MIPKMTDLKSTMIFKHFTLRILAIKTSRTTSYFMCTTLKFYFQPKA